MQGLLRTTTVRCLIAIGLSMSCGGRADPGPDEAGPSGGAAGASPTGGSSGGADASDNDGNSSTGGGGGSAGSGATGGGAGAAGGAGGSGGAGGAGASGGTGGATGGVGGNTSGGAGTSGTGGSGGIVDAGDPADISAPQDVGPPQDVQRDTHNPDGCTPISCTPPLGTYCGWIGDGCGGAMDCGTCPGAQVCGQRRPNICGAPCPLCPQIPQCESGVTTVRGKAVTGAAINPDPLYAATVFIPNVAPGGKLPPLTDGPSCNRCKPLTESEAITSAITGPDGTFTLQNVPAGTGIPLVVQLDHWRYETTIDVLPCVTNELAPGTARLPRTQSEGNIPLTAISTGNVDALECILRKIGVADTEFSNPSESGRIHFYRNNGAIYDMSTPNQAALVDTPATWDRYDQILFPCEGLQSNESAPALMNFNSYTNKGGRVITTHFSYTWLYQNGGFATAGDWQVNQVNPANPLISDIDTSTPKGHDFATWLGIVGALSNANPPRVSINDPRHNLNAVPPNQGGRRWIYTDTPPIVQHMTIDTPVAATPDKLCGRVIYSDFHVANALNTPLVFPAECPTADLTAQEKILEFMLLDLATCGIIEPPPPPPPPPPLPPRD
jgi:hypothetical protein